jgi:hypothetical protein
MFIARLPNETTEFSFQTVCLICSEPPESISWRFLLPMLDSMDVKHLSARYSAPERLYRQASYPILNYMGWQQATFG